MPKEKNKKRQDKKSPHKQNLPKNKIEYSRHYDFIGLGIIILLGIIIYSNSFICTFHLDDFTNIVINKTIQQLSDLKALWDYEHFRFIPYLSFALNYHFDKLNVWGYHLVNLIVHLINSVLVWWLTMLIFSSPVIQKYPIAKHKRAIAFTTALLFVTSPLATESVTYIVQRMASMAGLFYFLSLAFYIKARLTKNNFTSQYLLFVGSIISAVFAILSKENAITIPLAIVLVEVFFMQTKRIPINFKDYRVLLAMAGMAALLVIILWRFSFNIFDAVPPYDHSDYRTITSSSYLLTQFTVIPQYIRLLFLPVNQNFDNDIQLSNSFFEVKTIAGFLFLISLIILAVQQYNKNRIFSFGIFWFFITIAVESSIIPISDLMFEHRTYIPSYGFYLILGTAIFYFLWNNYKNAAIALLLVIIVSNSYLTYARNKVWKDELTMWKDIAEKSPNKARAFGNLAAQYNRVNNLPEAIKAYKRAIELNPKWIHAYCNLGNVLTVLKDYKEAAKYIDKAMELDSAYSDVYDKRGNLFTEENKFDEAINDYSKSIKLSPDVSDTYSNRGNVFTKMHKYDEALNDLNKSIQLDSSNSHAYLNRGCLFNNQKKRKEALVDLNKAIEIQKDYTQAYFNRGIVNLNIGNKANACMDLKKAMSLGCQPADALYKQYCQ